MSEDLFEREVKRIRELGQATRQELSGRPRTYSPTQQLRRWMQGRELERLARGQISPEQYQEYDQEMRRRYTERRLRFRGG